MQTDPSLFRKPRRTSASLYPPPIGGALEKVFLLSESLHAEIGIVSVEGEKTLPCVGNLPEKAWVVPCSLAPTVAVSSGPCWQPQTNKAEKTNIIL